MTNDGPWLVDYAALLAKHSDSTFLFHSTTIPCLQFSTKLTAPLNCWLLLLLSIGIYRISVGSSPSPSLQGRSYVAKSLAPGTFINSSRAAFRKL